MYTPFKVTNQLDISEQQKQIFIELAHDLRLIKQACPFLDDIIVRSGFILDTLLNAQPFDVDAYYTTKEQVNSLFSKCRCDEIRENIKNLNFKILDKKYPLDLGHSGEGEIYLPPIEKNLSFHSHLFDLADMVCLNDQGELWANDEAVNAINNKTHEIRYDGWLLHPYFIRVFPHDDYYYFVTANSLRGLKMIHTKKYTNVGPNYRLLLENLKPIIDYVANVPDYVQKLKKYHEKKCRNMSREDLKKALAITAANNQSYLLEKFTEIIFN